MRQEQLAKISELLSDPTSCKLGLELVKQLKVTAQEMCNIILKSKLDSIKMAALGQYLLDVDPRVFSFTIFLADGKFGEFTLREIELAKWKSKRDFSFYPNGDHHAQQVMLMSMGVL